MPKWKVWIAPGAVYGVRTPTSKVTTLLWIEAITESAALTSAEIAFLRQGIQVERMCLRAEQLTREEIKRIPSPSWNVYLKTGPLVTYPSIDEEEALRRLAKMCDEWGLSLDSFVLERKE